MLENIFNFIYFLFLFTDWLIQCSLSLSRRFCLLPVLFGRVYARGWACKSLISDYFLFHNTHILLVYVEIVGNGSRFLFGFLPLKNWIFKERRIYLGIKPRIFRNESSTYSFTRIWYMAHSPTHFQVIFGEFSFSSIYSATHFRCSLILKPFHWVYTRLFFRCDASQNRLRCALQYLQTRKQKQKTKWIY